MSARGAVVWVDGRDSRSFLHGLLSNDVAALAVGASQPALLLDATGHVRVLARVVCTGESAFTLLTDADSGERLAQLLDEYHFSEDVEIIGPEPVDLVTYAEAVTPLGADLVIEGSVPGTCDAVGVADVIRQSTTQAAIDDVTLDARRIAAGVPRFGVDLTERTLVHEAGLETTAVSFTKGCYLGQETVARVEHRGGVNRRLVGLRLPEMVPTGADVHAADRVVGSVTSVAGHPTLGPIGLATLRKEVDEHDQVFVSDLPTAAIVVTLPFPGSWTTP